MFISLECYALLMRKNLLFENAIKRKQKVSALANSLIKYICITEKKIQFDLENVRVYDNGGTIEKIMIDNPLVKSSEDCVKCIGETILKFLYIWKFGIGKHFPNENSLIDGINDSIFPISRTEASFIECCMMFDAKKRLDFYLLADHILIKNLELSNRIETLFFKDINSIARTFNGINKSISYINIGMGGFGEANLILKPKIFGAINSTLKASQKVSLYVKKISANPCPEWQLHKLDIKKYLCRECTKHFYNSNEYLVGSTLNDANTPNVPKYYKFAQRHKIIIRMPYGLYLSYAPGFTLSKYVENFFILKEDDAKIIIRELANTITSANEVYIMHRDIKPDNIIINYANGSLNATLIDFGVAKINTNGITRLRPQQYFSPEMIDISYQISNQPYGHETDVWSLGVILYELLYHKRMIWPANLAITELYFTNNKLEFPVNSGVSVAAFELIYKLLKYRTIDRIKVKNIQEQAIFKDTGDQSFYKCAFYIKAPLKVNLIVDNDINTILSDVEANSNKLAQIDMVNREFNQLCL